MKVGDKLILESPDGFDMAVIDEMRDGKPVCTFITGILKGEKTIPIDEKMQPLQLHTDELEQELRVKHKSYIDFVNKNGSPYHRGGWEPNP